VVDLSLDSDQISATYLSKAIEILVKPKYAADASARTTPEDEIPQLAASVSRLAKQVRPLGNQMMHSGRGPGCVSFDFWADNVSGVALDLETGVPCYQVEDEEGRIHLLLQLPIAEANENRWCLWRPDQAEFDFRSIFDGALVEE
jgi:hypothetical protein